MPYCANCDREYSDRRKKCPKCGEAPDIPTIVGRLKIEIAPCGTEPLSPASSSEDLWDVDISSVENDFHIRFCTKGNPTLELRYLTMSSHMGECLDVQYVYLNRTSKIKVNPP